MEKREFARLFRSQLELAACAADQRLSRQVPRQFGILRNTPGPSGRRITFEQAVEELFVSESAFFLIIDVAVAEVTSSTTWVWVRESGHAPGPFEVTWNQPPGSGPFKQVAVGTIRVVD